MPRGVYNRNKTPKKQDKLNKKARSSKKNKRQYRKSKRNIGEEEVGVTAPKVDKIKKNFKKGKNEDIGQREMHFITGSGITMKHNVDVSGVTIRIVDGDTRYYAGDTRLYTKEQALKELK